MPRTRPTVPTKAVLALFLCLSWVPSTLSAQECLPARVDSAVAQSWVDSLPPQNERPRPAWVDSLHARRHHPPSDYLDIRVVGIRSRNGCWTAAAIRWERPFGGALALLRPDGTLAQLSPYSDIGNLRSAGVGRLAFTYLLSWGSGYGLGVRSYDFVVLCKYGGWHWATCLEQPELASENTAREWMAPDSSVGIYTADSSTFLVQGDSVLMHRYFGWLTVYDGGSLGKAHHQDLGTTVFRLPRADR